MKYVLGSGLNALIFAYYNPDFTVLETRPPQGDEGAGTGSVVLYENPENLKLLKDLGLALHSVKGKILYYYNGKCYPYMAEPVLTDYVMKKLNYDETLLGRDRTLTIEGDEFSYFLCPIGDLYERLRMHVEVVSCTCDAIYRGFLSSSRGTRYYDILVSTLPAPVFWKLWRGRKPDGLELRGGGATFVIKEEPPEELQGQDFSVAYFADSRDFHKVLHLGRNYTYEYPDQREGVYKEHSFLKTDPHNVPPTNVLFCGRHARWQHGWRLHDTVRMATENYTWERMWNRQAAFQANFSDYNREIDGLTEDTIYQMACVDSELHSLLNALNWKRWIPGEKIDRACVLVEYVDALKFMLGLGAIWGFSADEVARRFHTKSNEVEEAYYGQLLEEEKKS